MSFHFSTKMANVIRKRVLEDELQSKKVAENTDTSERKPKHSKDHYLISWKEVIFICLCVCGLVAIAVLPHFHLPHPKTERKMRDWVFTAQKARSYLEGLTQIGHRTAGSYRNDILAVDYLLKQVYSIISHAHVHYHVDVDVQTASGAFGLHFLGRDFTIAYENITNIIVHVYPKSTKDFETNVLLNCHFDTQPRTEGASDDAVSCAIMLETMRAITRSPPRTIKQGIIFLFNGDEEGLLSGSHAFVTQHKLASTVKALVNLEAAGSGGREVVFQTGPGHPWLIKTYASVAKYPFASIVGQEIFQSGFIPSDTDFRIFRDYGGVVGIDIAYSSNGYVYHTRHDNASIIPDGSIQRGGANILALVKALSKSPYLAHKEEYKQGKVVYFDFLGLFMVIFPEKIGTLLNYCCVAVALTYIAKELFFTSERKTSSRKPITMLSLIIAITSILLSWTSAFLVSTMGAFMVTKCGRSLSWYSHPWFSLILYGVPAFCTILVVHNFTRYAAKKFGIKFGNNREESIVYEKSCVLAHMVIISCFVTIMTYKGILSTFLFTNYLLFPIIFHCIIRSVLLKSEFDDLYSVKLVSIHILATAFPIVLVSYHLFSLFDVFVPIMGRQGSEIPPDIVFAIFCTLTVIILTLYLVSLTHLTADIIMFIKISVGISIISFLAVVLGFMFPYSSEGPVAPKRIFMQHVVRNFHNKDGRVYKNDSGIWFVPLDYLGMKPVMHLSSLKDLAETECDGPYCGYPYFLPIRNLMKATWYLKGPLPFTNQKKFTSFKVTKKEQLNDNIVRYHFRVSGPDHMTLYITPNKDNKLVKWSLTEEKPLSTLDYDGRMTYYTYYIHGFYSKPWDFWLDFEVNVDADVESISDIALAGHFLHGPLSMTKWMQKIIGGFPSWVVDVAFVSSYDAWRL